MPKANNLIVSIPGFLNYTSEDSTNDINEFASILGTVIGDYKRGKPIKSGIAMTGELSVRGRVLKVGGILEKLIAAKREHITEIILPFENKSEFEVILLLY